MLAKFIYLLPLLPLLAAFWIGLSYIFGHNRGESGEKMTAKMASVASLSALILILIIDLQAMLIGVPGSVTITNWLSSGNYQINISFYLDTLSLSLLTLISLISFLTIRFSINYLHREASFQRFFIILLIFSAAMFLIVSAGNMVLTFVGWEMAGVCSYLLIAYNFDRPIPTTNASRIFITNRIGDAGLIASIVLSFMWIGDIEWHKVLQQPNSLSSLQLDLIIGGFLLAALVKSAQFPFSPWISRALEGPTPSSAIFYGSLMVHSGVYLMLRLQPLLQQNETLLVIIAIFGLITALYGYFTGLVQTDVKSAFIFSTIAHVGLMFLLIGLEFFVLASWYLVLHAIWRAYHFLHAPSQMHNINQAARSVPAWLAQFKILHTASLQRFWLDNISNWMIVRPMNALAHDAQSFDEKIVSRLIGKPKQQYIISSLANWEKNKDTLQMTDKAAMVQGHGLIGSFMEWLASLMEWFEEHLILKSGGEGLLDLVQKIGTNLQKIENLLNQPRYLMILVSITFIIII